MHVIASRGRRLIVGITAVVVAAAITLIAPETNAQADPSTTVAVSQVGAAAPIQARSWEW